MGLIGVVAALLIFNWPLGFVAILGILALLGMIARNAVILIDQIEAERAEGKVILDAMVDAAMSRFRPIELTLIFLPALYVTYEPTGEGRVTAWASPDRFDSALASWRITSRECHARSRVRRPKIVKQEAAT
jgi:hypothetical protein